MAKQVAPPKSTGGGGFVFADRVCAWFLSHMLSNEPPLDQALGHLESIHFEVRPDGWYIDDLLLTLVDSQGEKHRCAFSVKSNVQFSGSTAPQEFVRLAWEQFVGEGSSVFNEKTDFMGLVTTPLSPETKEALNFVVDTARKGDAQLLPNRYSQVGWASEEKRLLFLSFACPEDFAKKHGITANDIGRLLARLHFLQFDIKANTSEKEKETIERCRRALRSGETDEAGKLWECLISIAATRRSVAGCITRTSLLDELRTLFELVDLPNHQADWVRLHSISSSSMAQVQDKIGGRVHLNRETEIRKLQESLDNANCIILLGPSGVGKSAIAKEYAHHFVADEHKCLWFNAYSFQRVDFSEFQSELQLSHTLKELLTSIPDNKALLVLDGLERLYDNKAFALVANLLSGLDLGRFSSPWKVVVTCQTQEWGRLQQCLFQAGLLESTWSFTECKPISVKELEPVWQAFPKTRRLVYQEKLKSLLSNLKILDLIARHIVSGGDIETSRWVGESSIANWFWESQVAVGNEGPQRERFVMMIAEKQTNDLRIRIPLDSFSVSELTPLGGLIQDRVCCRIDEGVAFTHDLYGDWARLRQLIGHTSDMVRFLEERLESPLWHRAVRLYGAYLLEQPSGLNSWRELLSEFTEVGNEGASDLLLESIIFSSNPDVLLASVHSDLLRDEGILLKRLLNRFLIFATLPNPRCLSIAREEGCDEASVAAQFRYPNFLYWPPVLRFLSEHRDEIISVALVEIAHIIELWLNHTQEGVYLRRESAELGLMLGWRACEIRNNYRAPDHEHRKLYYQIALAGAGEFPDEVAEFALKASERIEDENEEIDESPEQQRAVPSIIESDPRYDPNEPLPEPWPDGPKAAVDNVFKEAVLNSHGIIQLIHVRPTIAREIILASLINERRHYEWYSDYITKGELDLYDDHNWFPALYCHGPFLNFLHINFEEGFETIARLIDFATERWVTHTKADASEYKVDNSNLNIPQSINRMINEWNRPPCTVILPLDTKEREIIGDYRVYGWSGACVAPKVVQVALMALEKYFYQEVEKNQPVEDKIRLVLERTQSVALLKILCDVGKRENSLFKGPLRPLLAMPEIYIWEFKANAVNRQSLMWGAERLGRHFVSMADEFHNMEHRSYDLRHIAVQHFVNNKQTREYLNSIRERLEKRLSCTTDDEYKDIINQLIIGFNTDNYRAYEHPEYSTVIGNVRALKQYDEQAKERGALEEQVFLTSLPLSCLMKIDYHTVLSEEELDTFWDKVYRLSLTDTEESGSSEPSRELISNTDRLTGAAALLICLHTDWLAVHPERKQWCFKNLKKAVINPPRHNPYDVPYGGNQPSWDCFAAYALPILWSEEPNSDELRYLIARLVFLAPHYSAVKILFERCSELRVVFGSDFNLLRRLVFESAFIRSRLNFIQQFQHFPKTLTKKEVKLFYKNVEKWARKSITKFVRRKLLPPTVNWNDMDQPKAFKAIDGARVQRMGYYLVDFELIKAAHEWLPNLDQALNTQERLDWLSFWRNALMFVLSRVAKDTDNGNYPHENDYWVLDCIATILTIMTPEERHESYWKPILDLPSDAHLWPEYFLNLFHLIGLQKDPVPQQFVSTRSTIIEYVLGETSKESASRWPYHEDVWKALLGIDTYPSKCWEQRHRDIAEQSYPFLERWMSRDSISGRHLAALASWLKTEATDHIRLPALVLLHNAIITEGAERISNLSEAEESVASLLHHTWQKDESRLKRDSKAFSAFKDFLRWLVGRQNHLALHLVGKLGGLEG